MIGTVLFPVIFSFEKQIQFYKKWKLVFLSGLVPASFFIVWDILFTQNGVWSFGDKYIIGLKLAGLPIEEWSFFFLVPFSSLFIYEVLKFYFPNLYLRKTTRIVNLFLFVFSSILVYNYSAQAYTFYNFLFVMGVILLSFVLPRYTNYGSYFMLTWSIGIIPMFLVNGILTALPVVSYNPMENTGFRIYTIPFEDFFYYFVLLFMNVSIYDFVSHKKNSSIA